MKWSPHFNIKNTSQSNVRGSMWRYQTFNGGTHSRGMMKYQVY